MTFPVVWLMPDVVRHHDDSRHRLTWAQHQVETILTRLGGQHLVGFDELGDDAVGACVVIPAEYYVDQAQWVHVQVNNLDWAVVFLTSDEASRFPANRLSHRLDRMRLWVQTPRPGVHHTDRFIPFGPPPDTVTTLAGIEPGDRKYDWSFSGQVNHGRRSDLAAAVHDLPNGYMNRTGGFTQGLPRREFLELLTQTKVVPCPAGPETPDSFRLWEALEAGCVPVADGKCPAYDHNYWQLLFGGQPPFPVIEDWADFPQQVGAMAGGGWQATANGAGSWWQQYQRRLYRRIRTDIEDVSRRQVDTRTITVLIPTSPIPSHPDTAIIEETVASVRYWLPDADILIMADGVRDEQEHRRDDYEAYQARLLWLAAHQFGNCTIIRHDTHQHQANMTRQALTRVDTPLILFVEHDTPLVTDCPIDWDALQAPLVGDELDVIRLHHEALILEPHQHLMVDEDVQTVAGCPVLRTLQWSQRPHLARADFYRRLLDDHFVPSGRTMIEDLAHGVVQRYPWRFHRLAIYAPPETPGNIKRSLHSDGRGSDPKYDMRFV